MDLSSNRFSFGESAFVAVAEMLGRNVGLRHLDLSDNRVARWALTALAGALSLVLLASNVCLVISTSWFSLFR